MAGTKGQSGRKRKPTKLRALEGGRSRKANSEAEPDFAPVSDALAAPDYLSGRARDEWERLVPELRALGLLPAVSVHVLAGACMALHRAMEAEATVTEEGQTYRTTTVGGAPSIKPHPAVAALRSHWAAYRSFVTEFGLTPASAGKVAGVSPPNRQQTAQEYFTRERRR